ncbi:MAG: NADH-quinone oxidoreductase subunit NuoK [Candidatus Dadabacteria bacterium]|nr:NADH-quinone oxidoreductase subunit NuoK [Candidatus Dadabacteria bacterium]
MSGITPEHYFVLSAILFVIGAFGVIARKNLIIVLMSLELMLNAANLAFIAFSRVHGDITGHVFMIMSITVAAAEVAVGLALVVAVYAHKDSLNVDILRMLKG